MFDRKEAQAFLQRRFGDSEGYLATAIGVGGRFKDHSYEFMAWKEHQFNWPSEEELVLLAMEQVVKNYGTADIYVCPVLRSTGARTKRNGVASKTVFADLDGVTSWPEQLNPYLEIVNSGSSDHYHVYIQLTDAVSIPQLEAFNKALASVTKADSKWSNNTVLRLPGTTNHKHGFPVAVKQLAQSEIAPNDLQTLLKYFMPSVGDDYISEAEIGRLKVIDTKLPQYLYDRMNEDSSKDRSGQSFHFISACYEAGLSDDEVFTAASNHMPTIEKYGVRRDGIAEQVLDVKRYRLKKNLVFVSNLAGLQ